MLKTKLLLVPALAMSTVSHGACAENYTVEGAVIGAAAGAGLAAITGGDITRC